MLRGEGGDCDLRVFVDDSGFDFMGVHLPALGVSALVSLGICSCLNVDPIRLQNVLGHGLESRRTIHFERCAPTGGPAGQDEIRIASRVIGVKVRRKSYLQVGGLKRRDVPVENSRLSATRVARSISRRASSRWSAFSSRIRGNRSRARS